MEEWKFIDGADGKYQVSNLGRVKSLARAQDRLLKVSPDNEGYLYVSITLNGKSKRCLVSRLVAKSFLGVPSDPDANEVNHIDFDKSNNRTENLEWTTKQKNLSHARNGGRWDDFFSKKRDEKLKRIVEQALEKKAIREKITPQNIKLLRQSLGITQKQASIALGVNLRTWSRWEAGVSAMPISAWQVLNTKQLYKTS